MSQRLSSSASVSALSPREVDLKKTFLNLLKLDNKKVFSADDFFGYGLDHYFSNPSRMAGSFFRKLQHFGVIEQAGYIHSTRPSNNGREIRVWRLKP